MACMLRQHVSPTACQNLINSLDLLNIGEILTLTILTLEEWNG